MQDDFESKLAYTNSTVPFLAAVVGEIEELSAEHRSIKSRLAAVNRSHQLKSSDDLYSQEIEAVANSANELENRMSKCFAELNQVAGLIFNEQRPTFVDFPTETAFGEIVFCWKCGEREICHWHWADETCESRKALVELAEMGISALPA